MAELALNSGLKHPHWWIRRPKLRRLRVFPKFYTRRLSDRAWIRLQGKKSCRAGCCPPEAGSPAPDAPPCAGALAPAAVPCYSPSGPPRQRPGCLLSHARRCGGQPACPLPGSFGKPLPPHCRGRPWRLALHVWSILPPTELVLIHTETPERILEKWPTAARSSFRLALTWPRGVPTPRHSPPCTSHLPRGRTPGPLSPGPGTAQAPVRTRVGAPARAAKVLGFPPPRSSAPASRPHCRDLSRASGHVCVHRAVAGPGGSGRGQRQPRTR